MIILETASNETPCRFLTAFTAFGDHVVNTLASSAPADDNEKVGAGNTAPVIDIARRVGNRQGFVLHLLAAQLFHQRRLLQHAEALR